MPNLQSFPITRGDNIDLLINLAPPTSISGWTLALNVGRQFGGAGDLIQTSTAVSGGITVQNAGQGVFSIPLTPSETSGLDFGNYAYWVRKTAPDNIITLIEGYLQVQP